jgi:hypothetical protein
MVSHKEFLCVMIMKPSAWKADRCNIAARLLSSGSRSAFIHRKHHLSAIEADGCARWEADRFLLSLPSYPLLRKKASSLGKMFHTLASSLREETMLLFCCLITISTSISYSHMIWPLCQKHTLSMGFLPHEPGAEQRGLLPVTIGVKNTWGASKCKKGLTSERMDDGASTGPWRGLLMERTSLLGGKIPRYRSGKPSSREDRSLFASLLPKDSGDP